MNTEHEVIKQLGGTRAVAEYFGVLPPTVSEWKKLGIPKARKQTMAFAFPDIAPKDWYPPGHVQR